MACAETINNTTKLIVPSQELGLDVPVYLWSPPGTSAELPLPLLVVNDGPEYAERAALLRTCQQFIVARLVNPYRMALVEPVMGYRDEWYGASPAYDEAMARSIVPAIGKEVNTTSPVLGMGASLGALAMLSMAFRDDMPLFDGLFFQSGTFHHSKDDERLNDYVQLGRVMQRVREIMSEPAMPELPPLQIGMTCGGNEENLPSSLAMAAALNEQGHNLVHKTVPSGHDFESWGKALDPHLLNWLQRCLGKPQE